MLYDNGINMNGNDRAGGTRLAIRNRQVTYVTFENFPTWSNLRLASDSGFEVEH